MVATVLYASTLDVPFHFDDADAVVGNTSIRTLSGALTPPARGEPVAGRPLVNLSFALNYAAGGLAVEGYHAVNLALHVACALVMLALVRRTLDRQAVRDATPLAVAVVLLWTVHPLASETVTYVSQRTESMMALCYLLTLYAFARGWAVAAIVACAAGMACKETMVTAPVMVFLYDRTFVAGSFSEALRARRGFYAALAGTWIVLVALIWSGPRWESAGFASGVSPWTYLLNQAVMLVEYLQRALWPTGLVFDYGEPLPVGLGDVWLQATVVLLLLVATVVALVRRPVLGWLGAWFFVLLAPTSSIVPIATEVGAERRMYLSLAAVVALAVFGARTFWTRLSGGSHTGATRVAATIALCACTVGLSSATLTRTAEYADEQTLWQTVLDRWPSARAHRNMATALKRAGRDADALPHLRAATVDHPEARFALGYELVEQGQLAEGVVELERYLRDYPRSAEAVTAHALAAGALVRLERVEEAAGHFARVTALAPGDGQAWLSYGTALAELGRLSEAEDALRRAVALQQSSAGPSMMLGLVLEGQGRLAEAVASLERAAAIDPTDAETRAHLARVRSALPSR
ncbi:MAG: tetratricopeptide repeat protein [Vicinamibacterales bacterium]